MIVYSFLTILNLKKRTVKMAYVSFFSLLTPSQWSVAVSHYLNIQKNDPKVPFGSLLVDVVEESYLREGKSWSIASS